MKPAAKNIVRLGALLGLAMLLSACHYHYYHHGYHHGHHGGKHHRYY